MKLFLVNSRYEKIIMEMLRNEKFASLRNHVNILESFYYIRKGTLNCLKWINKQNFLLDSGAFTFLKHAKKVNFDEYLANYARFINENNVELFFELDIDAIVGLEKVEEYRRRLEELTGKKPIPVWHKSRGKEYFVKMCQEYPYVAIGGYVLKEMPKSILEGLFPWFIKTAHSNNAKIHVLGYTSIPNLWKFNIDSVDSNRWAQGNISGFFYKYQSKKMDTIFPPDKMKINSYNVAMNNFIQFVKLSKDLYYK